MKRVCNDEKKKHIGFDVVFWGVVSDYDWLWG